MIVEDHVDMRRMLNNMVASCFTESVEIIECESGEEAVEQYMLTKPNCVLMDFQLTKMNGLEATKLIFERDSQATIIFVTSYDSPSLRKKAEDLCILGFISKNNLSALTQLLQTLSPK